MNDIKRTYGFDISARIQVTEIISKHYTRTSGIRYFAMEFMFMLI